VQAEGSGFSRASGAKLPDGTSHEKRFSIFVASFVGSFVENVPDKARDNVSQIRVQGSGGVSCLKRWHPKSLKFQGFARASGGNSNEDTARGNNHEHTTRKHWTRREWFQAGAAFPLSFFSEH
jgi:hypothetical protein